MNLFKTLKAMLQVAPKSDVRYYLNGVQVIRDGDTVQFNATDGIALLHVKTTDLKCVDLPDPCDFVMCRKSLDVMLKSFNAKSMFRLKYDGRIATFESGTLGGLPIETITGSYPDVRRVITESSERCDAIGVNFKQLALISRACATLNSEKPWGTLQVRGVTDSIRFENSYDDYSFIGLLMPARI